MKPCLILALLLPGLAFAQSPPPLVPVREGSGLVINAEGEVLTNAHVVEGCAQLEVTLGNVHSPANLRARDATNDLALLRTTLKPRAHAHFAPAEHTLRVGEHLRIIGFPGDSGQTTTPATLTRLSGPTGEPRWITLDSHAAPGNSGGPVLNAAGQVVAIMNGGITATPTNKHGEDSGPAQHVADVAITAKQAKAFLRAQQAAYVTRPTIDPTGTSYTAAIRCIQKP